jgi:hypothetical protein
MLFGGDVPVHELAAALADGDRDPDNSDDAASEASAESAVCGDESDCDGDDRVDGDVLPVGAPSGIPVTRATGTPHI